MGALDNELARRRAAGFLQVGMKVHYHPIIDEDHDGKVCTVRDIDVDQGRVWLEGKSGFVTIEALSNAEGEG